MIRDDRHVMSHKPYAIDLSTLRGEQQPRGDRWAYSGTVNAVWYRRKGGVTRACIGTLGLWSHILPSPLDLGDPRAVLSADLDGRYGGDCQGRWDGESYWGNVPLAVQEQHLAVLRPMLDGYPDLKTQPPVPAGFDGWWRFDG